MNNEFFMNRCIELAKKSEGNVSPNPLVGCVIVNDKEEIIAEGRHEKYGEAHAEQNALKLAGASAKNSTLFVNLEPCNHYGKTPPCAKLIAEAGVKKVVIGTRDINKTAQGGIEFLKSKGIEIEVGILEKECKKLNEIFFFSLTHKRPFIAIKTATTLDGKIAAPDSSSKWITSEKARNEVQKLRNKYDGILTTSRTVQIDNPSLTCRMENGKNPIRIIVDRENILNESYKVFNNDGTKVIKFSGNLDELMEKLYEENIKSVLVESGGTFNGALLKAGYVDKIYHFIAPKILGNNDGISCYNGLETTNINNAINFHIEDVKNFSPDIMLELYPQSHN